LLLTLSLATAPAIAAPHRQQATHEAPPETGPVTERPLPDIPTLMHQVEVQQKASEAIEKNYLYHSVEAIQEMDKHGDVKKTQVNEYDELWINGVPVRRMVKKNGQELSAAEKKQEDERIDKESARARARRDKADAQGKPTDPRGEDEVTVSRLLELGRFSNAHRLTLHGRNTIVVDYIGDPKAKTRTSFENVIRDLVGTIWIDEQDQAIARIEGHFVDNFKVGGGLLVNIQKGLTFSLEQTRVNDEVWLPARVEGHGSARALLFFRFNGAMTVMNSGYHKFKADSTIVSAGTQNLDAPAKTPEAPK
jgi:hypothetical protein